MRAYKGFPENMRSRLGDGKEENCQFHIGETKEVESSKTVRSGFHCCENPFDCTRHYAFDGKNRFFEVEAAGSIDEDATEKIACTKMTIVKELKPEEFFLEGVRYMIAHPLRSDWKIRTQGLEVCDRTAFGTDGCIAISRCENPRVKAEAGCLCGLIQEVYDGCIEVARIFRAKEDGTYELHKGKVVKV